MTPPRVLVVRSGANPFVSVGPSGSVDVVEVVSHEILPVTPPPDAFAGPADLAVFTSQVAVERIREDAALASRFRQAAGGAAIAAVGPVTAEALRAIGLAPAIVAEGSGEALLEHLPPRLEGRRILRLCGEDAAPELADGLRGRGARVESVVIYRKAPRRRDARLDRDIVERPFAAFCATSPSAAAWLFDGLAAEAAARLRATPAVVLGRFTRRMLEAHGVERLAVTPEPRFPAALALLEELAATAGAA